MEQNNNIVNNIFNYYFLALQIVLLLFTGFRINQACTMIECKIHEYVEVYKKQSRKKKKNILVLLNTLEKTEKSDGPYLQKDNTNSLSFLSLQIEC